MRISLKLAGAVVLVTGMAGPATASTAPAGPALGTYTGTAADGSSVSFTVTSDPTTQLPAVTSATVFFTTTCPSPHPSTGYGVGFGLNAPVKQNKAVYASPFPTGTYVSFSLLFDPATNSLTGTTATAIATLVSSTRLPTRSYACTSPKQALTATLQAPAAGAQPGPAAAYVYDRRGRIIGTLSK